MNKIKWGILSTARINQRLIPAMHNSERGDLYAVSSRDPVAASVFAREWKIPVSYGTYLELLADPEIDVVYIPLPNNLHKEWIILSLEAGKHVLCEKPMCLSIEDHEEVTRVSKATNKILMEAYMHLYHPQTHLWKEIIDSGQLGDIHSMFSNFTFTLNRPADNFRWTDPAGGGALWDIGIYPISLMQFLMNEPGTVKGATQFIEDQIDLSTQAHLEFKHGIAGQLNVSFRSAFSTDTIIHGSEGQLYISHPFTNVTACKAYIRHGDQNEYLTLPNEYLYNGEVEAMHDCILKGMTPAIDLEFSRNILNTVLEIKNSN